MVFSLMSTTAFAFENNTIDEPLPSDIEFPSMDIPLMESAGEELETVPKGKPFSFVMTLSNGLS